jgi:hypothetical protein
MKFSGTLIEELMATVERAEQRAQPVEALAVEPMLADACLAETWFSSAQANADYDSKLLGVA